MTENQDIAKVLKQAMDDWDNATDEQRADALAKAAALANGAKKNTTDHCATCGHYREWHACYAPATEHVTVRAADEACELYTTDRASGQMGIGD